MKQIIYFFTGLLLLTSCSTYIKNTPLPVELVGEPVKVNVQNDTLNVAFPDTAINVNVLSQAPNYSLIPYSEIRTFREPRGVVNIISDRTRVINYIQITDLIFGNLYPTDHFFLEVNLNNASVKIPLANINKTPIVVPQNTNAVLKYLPPNGANGNFTGHVFISGSIYDKASN